MVEDAGIQKAKTLPGWLSAVAIAAVVKFKSLLWLGGSLLTMILSVYVFAQRDGFPYAIGLVLLILIHECGHWIWMKVLGLNPKAPMFIPGVGAFVAMTNLPAGEASRAWVALAGPLIGGLGCAGMFALGIHTGNHWLITSSNSGFMLNLMQLIPAKPLDGGFVVHAVSKWLLIPGTIIMFLLAFSSGTPLLYLLAIFSLLSLFSSWGKPRSGVPAANPISAPAPAHGSLSDPVCTPTVPTSQGQTIDESSNQNLTALLPARSGERVLIGIAYLGLIGILITEFLVSSLETGF